MKARAELSNIEIMEMSLKCFRFGMLGVLPFFGLPLAARSLSYYSRVWRAQSGLWNPARDYWRWGGYFALFGLIFCQVVPIALLAVAVYAYKGEAM